MYSTLQRLWSWKGLGLCNRGHICYLKCSMYGTCHLQHSAMPSCRGAQRLFLNSVQYKYCDSEHYLEFAKVRERLAVCKQEAQKFEVERFNFRKLSDLKVWKQYQIKI